MYLQQSSSFNLQAFLDFDWVADHDDRRLIGA
jgi:hypothetical protein